MKSAEAFDVMEPDGHRDALGRRRWSPARREELVREFGLGRVTPATFARKHGLCYTTLVTWLRRAGVVDDAKPRASSVSSTTKTTKVTHPAAPAFREVLIAPPASVAPAPSVVVIVPGGIEIRCDDVDTVVRLIRALGEAR